MWSIGYIFHYCGCHEDQDKNITDDNAYNLSCLFRLENFEEYSY